MIPEQEWQCAKLAHLALTVSGAKDEFLQAAEMIEQLREAGILTPPPEGSTAAEIEDEMDFILGATMYELELRDTRESSQP